MRIGPILSTAAAVLVMAAPLAAQQHHPKGQHRGEHKAGAMETPWRELNAFHSMLHESHHPLMTSGDLAPARKHAQHLAEAAEAWAESTPPAACNAPADVEAKIDSIAVEARSFARLVEGNGADADLKTALDRVHDRFEAAHMACMVKGHKPEHREHKPPHR